MSCIFQFLSYKQLNRLYLVNIVSCHTFNCPCEAIHRSVAEVMTAKYGISIYDML